MKQVSLIVYDLLGRKVKVLVNEFQQPGFYSVNFSGTSLASGVYIYELKSGGLSARKKMILLK